MPAGTFLSCYGFAHISALTVGDAGDIWAELGGSEPAAATGGNAANFQTAEDDDDLYNE